MRLEEKIKIAKDWLSDGDNLFNQGRYEEAIKCYDNAIALNQEDGVAWNNKGIALYNLSRDKEAVECFNTALKLNINPKDEVAWEKKGFAISVLGKYEEAIECYDKAIELNPKYELAWNSKGIALYNLRRYTEAIECFITALELNPKDAVIWYNMGLAYHRFGRYKESIECYDKAIELNPKDEQAQSDKGKALSDLRWYEETILNTKYEKTWNNKQDAAKLEQEGNRTEEERLRKEKERQRLKVEKQKTQEVKLVTSVTYLSIERAIYDPVILNFITSSSRPLPNVKSWIEKNDSSMYWLIICINNNSDKSIDEWGIELETPATLKIMDARIEGTEHTFNVTKTFSKPWLVHWILGVPHHLGVVIPRKGSRRIYLKLSSDTCGVSYSIKGNISTSDCEIPIKEKHFKYSCDAATLKVALSMNPEEAEKYAQTVLSNAYSKETALKLLQSFRIVREIDSCCTQGDYGGIKDKLHMLTDTLESAKAGERLIRMVRDNLESVSILGETEASAQRATKLCGNLVDLWINEILRT